MKLIIMLLLPWLLLAMFLFLLLLCIFFAPVYFKRLFYLFVSLFDNGYVDEEYDAYTGYVAADKATSLVVIGEGDTNTNLRSIKANYQKNSVLSLTGNKLLESKLFLLEQKALITARSKGMEEKFFEAHFEYGDDAKTIRENLEKANVLYLEFTKILNGYVENISDGLIVADEKVIKAIENLLFAKKFKETFKQN